MSLAGSAHQVGRVAERAVQGVKIAMMPARLEITLIDRFGHPVTPREWFLVPLFVIDEAIERIRDGTITGYRYDPGQGALVRGVACT